RVVQTNFNNYDPLRIDEMPVVEVHLVDSHESPGGIGEASTPTIVPAVANAVYAATRKRGPMLPMRQADLGELRAKPRALLRHVRRVFIVFLADVFNQLSVRLKHRAFGHRPRLRIRARIVDRDLHIHVPEILAMITLDYVELVRHRVPIRIEPTESIRSDGLH